MSNEILTECIPITTANEKYHIEIATLRKWVRDDKIPGIKIKPYQIHEPSLQAFLNENANNLLKKLYLKTESNPVAVLRKGTMQNVL